MKKIQFINKSVLFCMMTFLFCMIITLILPSQGYSQGAGLTLDFDGVDDYITIPSSSGDELNPQTNITVECWVYLNEIPSTDHQPHLVTKFNSYRLIIDNNGHPVFSIYSGGTWYSSVAVTVIQKNKWYHVAGTYDGTRLRIFVNGMSENMTNLGTSPLIQQNAEPVRIGASDPSLASYFTNGKIDGVRIWNTNRVPGQIQNSMNLKVPGNSANLVGLWRLDDGSGTNADDLSTYANDGTLTNMDPSSDWMVSNAPIGDASIFRASANIIETPACGVDVTFGTDADAPGTGFSLAAIQNNELPNDTDGLLLFHGNRYWELWSEDPDFDGDFSAAVNIHYDNVAGIPDESLLLLFRRDSASAPEWSFYPDFNVFTDDGGSSTISDGIGYVRINLSETSPGGFSGQYILCWQNRPEVTDITDQTVDEGSIFDTINLDDYVSDVEDPDSAIIWAYSGITELTVTIDENRVATIGIPDVNWFGSETITFTATDKYGISDTDSATFTVTSVNDLPVVSGIPDQTITEGNLFLSVKLDDFVSDIEDQDSSMTWSYAGNNWLTVTIDTNRIVAIDIPSINWFGADTIIFTATDKDGGSDYDTVIFTVTPVNDWPVVSDIPDQTILEGSIFTTINLDNFVIDVEDLPADIQWIYSGNTELTVAIDTNRVATIGTPDANWYGSETITFMALDRDGGYAGDEVVFTVTSLNDPPVVADIPDQTVDEGSVFAIISLDDYVSDVEDQDSEITWSYSANTELTVTIDVNRLVTMGIPDVNWFGADTIHFKATDKDGGSDNDTVIFTITAVNDLPIVTDIPDQTVDEGIAFATISLDDYVSDVEDLDSEITWDYSGNVELNVNIDVNRVVTIGISDVNWFGSETITFTATDKDGGTSTDTATFAVTSVNDLPVVTDIPDQTVDEGSVFSTINLDDWVSDVEDPDSEITWDYSANTELTVTIDVNRVVTIGIPDVNWFGSETITFTATDKDGGTGNNAAAFTVTSVNDTPVVLSKIPDASGAVLEEFIFTFSELTFGDFDPDDLLSYSAAQTTGDLPEWLSFNEITRAFTGTPASSDSGIYIIVVTATDKSLASVSDTFEIHIIGTTGIADLSEKWDVNIYPNPGNGIFYIDLATQGNEDIELKIFTLTGKLVWDQKYKNQIPGDRLTINLSNFNKDIYVLKVVTKSGIAVKQIILTY